ncbi:hypothetical protein [Blastopirellula retiformator]|uniref:Uncharacterized protein n=1 Tax=Blastopirellula retiformator TaxID=2527970 RepID=A0A5C5V806_9BACT|nr:hypothetical protein [Blastopirellula retiformator]TWT34684.1 hypothetical protein Enr8_20970 [Blastopirellula retiformator]
MKISRFAIFAVGNIIVIGMVAALAYQHGYTACYQELNHHNRTDVGYLMKPGDYTMVIRDPEKQNVLLECQLIASERGVQRLKALAAKND